jgi:hypothetical protein
MPCVFSNLSSFFYPCGLQGDNNLGECGPRSGEGCTPVTVCSLGVILFQSGRSVSVCFDQAPSVGTGSVPVSTGTVLLHLVGS